MTRTGTVERAYVDTLSLLDRKLVAFYFAAATVFFATLLLTAHWAGGPGAAIDAGAGPTALVSEATLGGTVGVDRAEGAVR